VLYKKKRNNEIEREKKGIEEALPTPSRRRKIIRRKTMKN